MSKKIILSSAILFIFICIGGYIIYSFQLRLSEANIAYTQLEDDARQASIYNSSRCLSPSLVAYTLYAINDLQTHTIQKLQISFLGANDGLTIQQNSFTQLIKRGIDCQLKEEEDRLTSWSLNETPSNKVIDFTESGERLTHFIHAFIDYEKNKERRDQLINLNDNIVDIKNFKELVQHLYPDQLIPNLPENSLLLSEKIQPVTIQKNTAKEIDQHIRTSLNMIDKQLNQQINIGIDWLVELQQATISSENITALADWINWLDSLPATCKKTAEELIPLLNQLYTSPLLRINYQTGTNLLSLNQQNISHCAEIAILALNNSQNSFSEEPLLSSVRGVSSGLVSPTWLKIALSLKTLNSQSFMIHSALTERNPEVFRCRPTTTDWDSQAATVMEKYIDEAIAYLTNKSKSIQSIGDNIEQVIVSKKLAAVINTLGNTAQQNLFITPSQDISQQINDTLKKSEKFALFSPIFLSAMEKAKSIGINEQLSILQQCVTDFSLAQLINASALIQQRDLLSPLINKENTSSLLATDNVAVFENWWEKELETIRILIKISNPYITITSNSTVPNNDEKNNSLQQWKIVAEAMTAYQNAENNNPISQLYWLYKKLTVLNSDNCEEIISAISVDTPSSDSIFFVDYEKYRGLAYNFCQGDPI